LLVTCYTIFERTSVSIFCDLFWANVLGHNNKHALKYMKRMTSRPIAIVSQFYQRLIVIKLFVFMYLLNCSYDTDWCYIIIRNRVVGQIIDKIIMCGTRKTIKKKTR